MLPGAYVFRMRSLRTANSLTSRNMSSAPPARTLMLYHYSVASPPSQGSTLPLVPFLHPLGQQLGLVPILWCTAALQPLQHLIRGGGSRDSAPSGSSHSASFWRGAHCGGRLFVVP